MELEIPTYYLYDLIVEKHKTINYSPDIQSFLVNNIDPNIFQYLYKKFLDKTHKILGSFNLLENNSDNCWAYVTNKDDYNRGAIHHHIRTSTINGIYYLNVPYSDNEKDGIITFFDDNDKELFWYKPRNGDLIIIPNFLKHQPQYISTNEYRVAINMEIFCDYLW